MTLIAVEQYSMYKNTIHFALKYQSKDHALSSDSDSRLNNPVIRKFPQKFAILSFSAVKLYDILVCNLIFRYSSW